jgi:hypothetical protein
VSEPRTEAGKRLLARLWGTPSTDASRISQIVAGLGLDILAIEAEAAAPLDGLDVERLARAMCQTQQWCDGTCPDIEGATAIHGAEAAAILAALREGETQPTWCVKHKAYDHCEDATLAALREGDTK